MNTKAYLALMSIVSLFVPFNLHANTLDLIGFGSANIDGAYASGEWSPAGSYDFVLNTPEGTTDATLFMMNDLSNMYVGLRFARSVVDPGNSFSIIFDNDNDGAIEQGDDVILYNPGSSLGFYDESASFTPPCSGICYRLDSYFGGSIDGSGAFSNDGVYSLYELSHPLNSEDDLFDFSLAPGDVIGIHTIHVRMIAANANHPEGFGDTFVYAGQYSVAAIPTPSALALLVPGLLLIALKFGKQDIS